MAGGSHVHTALHPADVATLLDWLSCAGPRNHSWMDCHEARPHRRNQSGGTLACNRRLVSDVGTGCTWAVFAGAWQQTGIAAGMALLGNGHADSLRWPAYLVESVVQIEGTKESAPPLLVAQRLHGFHVGGFKGWPHARHHANGRQDDERNRHYVRRGIQEDIAFMICGLVQLGIQRHGWDQMSQTH